MESDRLLAAFGRRPKDLHSRDYGSFCWRHDRSYCRAAPALQTDRPEGAKDYVFYKAWVERINLWSLVKMKWKAGITWSSSPCDWLI